MLRSFSARIALLILLPTALIQAQNLLPNPEFHTEASLLTAYSSSVSPSETQPDPTSEGFYRSDFTKSPAVKSANAQPQVASTSVRPFSKVGVGFNVGFLGIGAEIAIPLHQRGNLRVSGNAFQYSAPFNTKWLRRRCHLQSGLRPRCLRLSSLRRLFSHQPAANGL